MSYKPTRGVRLGHFDGKPTGWFDHTVVVKDGRVYDILTGPDGLPIAEYKQKWESPGDIDFGF